MKDDKLMTFFLIQLINLVIAFALWYFIPYSFAGYIALLFFSILFVQGLMGIIDFKQLKEEKSENSESIDNANGNIEMNSKNIFMLGIAIIFLIAAISYGINTADNELKEKRAKMMQMDIEQVAQHIIKHANGTHLDPVTKIADVRYKDNVLTFYYRVSLATKSMIKSIKSRVTGEFESEDCSKTASSVFLEKNGILHYRYYKSDINDEENFVFDVNVTKKACS